MGNLINSFISFPSTNDPDAQAFIDAVGTLTSNEESAINNLVVGLKADGLWSKLTIFYPFIGGTADSHKWNLLNPLDSDAAFRLTFSGTWVHDSDGITGDGSTAFANTYFIPNDELTANSLHHSAYFKNDITENSGYGVKSGSSYLTLYVDFGGTTYSYMYAIANSVSGSAGDTRAQYICNQNGGTEHKVFKDGIQVFSTNSGDNSASFSSLTLVMYLGAVNRDGTDGEHSTRTFSSWSIGTAFTDAEASSFYNRVQSYQTQLGRNN